MKQSFSDRILLPLLKIHARRAYARVEKDAVHANVAQEKLLLSLIRQNAGSDYGRDHHFNSIRTYADFRRNVPISSYAEFEPYINRVKEGDTSAMFAPGTRVHMFAMTSGTVATPKYIPITDRFLTDLRAGWHAFGIKALGDHPDAFLRPIVQVTSPMDEERSPSGVPCGAITGLMASTQKRLVKKYYVAPLPTAYITDTTARRYTIMRLAMPANVSWLVTASPATVLQLARTGDTCSESIIRDIHDGTLSSGFDIPAHVRSALASRLSPDPEAAKRLRNLGNTHGRLLPKHYWNLCFLANWTGGTMGLYLRQYPEYFGEIPIRDIGLLATEGRVSIPIHDGTSSGVAAVSYTFLEFIPAEEYGKPDPAVLRIHEVEAGRDYFILLTNAAGLYRYDICDCVRVTGFHHEAPLLEFLHKGAHIASITGEKLTERQVVQALDNISTSVTLDTSSAVLVPQWSDQPYYRLYVAADSQGTPHTLSETHHTLAETLDAEIQKINVEYASKRQSARLGSIQCRTLPAETLRTYDLTRATRFRSANEQYKHQYLLTKPGDDEDLSKM